MTNSSESQGTGNNSPDCTDDPENKLHPVESILPTPDSCVWLSDDAVALYKELVEKFKVAENDLKKAEVIDNKHRPLIPAINELRYCSHHLVNAISETSEDNQAEELRRAKRHCERASYDSLSISLSFLIMHINDYKNRFIPKNVVMTDIMASYPADMATVIEAQEELSADYKNKVEKYEVVRGHVEKLGDIYKTLISAESSIKAAAKRDSRGFKFAVAGAIAAFLIAGAGWYKAVAKEGQIENLRTEIEALRHDFQAINKSASDKADEMDSTKDYIK